MSIKKGDVVNRRINNKRISNVKLAEKIMQQSTLGEGKGITAFGLFSGLGKAKLHENRREKPEQKDITLAM